VTCRLPFAVVVCGLAQGMLAFSAAADTGTLLKGRATGAMVSSWNAYLEPADDGNLVEQPKLRAASMARGTVACVASKNPQEAKMLLAMSVADPGYGSKLTKLRDQMGPCMKGVMGGFTVASLNLDGSQFRGLMAEYFLRAAVRPHLTAEAQIRSSYAADWIAPASGMAVVEEMASCIAATHPDKVVELIFTTPGSSRERAARSAIMPFVAPCLGKGTTLNTDAIGLRLALAQGLYHRLNDTGEHRVSGSLSAARN